MGSIALGCVGCLSEVDTDMFTDEGSRKLPKRLQIVSLLAGVNKSQSSVILAQLEVPNSGPCAYLSHVQCARPRPLCHLFSMCRFQVQLHVQTLCLWSLLVIFQYFLFTSLLLLILYLNVKLPPSVAYR